jgi:hypothetical protein
MQAGSNRSRERQRCHKQAKKEVNRTEYVRDAPVEVAVVHERLQVVAGLTWAHDQRVEVWRGAIVPIGMKELLEEFLYFAPVTDVPARKIINT